MNQERTILHVDDDPDMLRIVARRLADEGYRVLSLSDPREVPARLSDSGARLALVDIEMPEMDGLSLLRQIKRDDASVQVIMLTGVVTLSTALRTMRYGAEACVFKPIDDFSPLLTAVDAAFAKLDRWWQSLEDLRRRKADSRDPVVTQT